MKRVTFGSDEYEVLDKVEIKEYHLDSEGENYLCVRIVIVELF